MEHRDHTLQPYHPSLNGQEAAAAVENQILHYPRVVRSKSDEPIEGQGYGLISFMLLKEPRQTKDGKTILGFFKLRGNWKDDSQCQSRGARIVREQDSKHKIRVCHVGEWLPLTDDDSLVKKMVNINLEDNDEEKHRAEAEMNTEEKKRQVMREMKEREEEVKNSKDINDDPESLDYYTMKMVVWMRLGENIDRMANDLHTLKGKHEDVRELLRTLDQKHPEYRKDWIDNYNKERRKSGFPDYVPSTKETDGYESTTDKLVALKCEIQFYQKKIEELQKRYNNDF